MPQLELLISLTYIIYTVRNKYYGKVLLGVQLTDKQMINSLIDKFGENKINFRKIEYNELYYDILV